MACPWPVLRTPRAQNHYTCFLGGKAALYADGHFVYSPVKRNFRSIHTFTYQVTDTSYPATVTLTIRPR